MGAFFLIVALIGFCIVYSGCCTSHILIVFRYMDSAHPELLGDIYFMAYGLVGAMILRHLWWEPCKTILGGRGAVLCIPLPQNVVLFVLSHSCNSFCTLLAHSSPQLRMFIDHWKGLSNVYPMVVQSWFYTEYTGFNAPNTNCGWRPLLDCMDNIQSLCSLCYVSNFIITF